MDRELDYEIYCSFDNRLYFEFETDPIHQRKVLHSRILKVSSAKSKYSYARMGIAVTHSEQPQKSIFLLKRFTTIDPDNTKVQTELTTALLKLERANECLDSLKKALSFSPQAGPLHRLLIETFEENHRLEDLESFVKEIASVITDPTALQDFYIVNAETLLYCNKYP